jgi:spermidine/putrescine transport system permease protein
LIAYPLAYWISFYGGRRKGMLLFLLIIPSWTSFLVRIYGWMFLLRDTGLINHILMSLHIIKSPLSMMYNPAAVIIGMVYDYFTFMLLPLYAAMDRLEPAVLEAAADLGANPIQRFFKVTLPLTKGGLASGTILVGVPAIGEFLVPDLLGGAKVTMVGNLIEGKFLEFNDWPFGSALAFVLAAVMIIAVVIYLRIGGKEALERLV